MASVLLRVQEICNLQDSFAGLLPVLISDHRRGGSVYVQILWAVLELRRIPSQKIMLFIVTAMGT
jgi:hypothetical protein